MKLHIAGIYTSNFEPGSNSYLKLDDRERWAHDHIEHELESFHYIEKQITVDKIRAHGRKLFIDSGAFSAYTKGVSIDLPTYCHWLQVNEDIVEKDDDILIASVLDGIGDPLATWRNQLDMEARGVKPLPCFHYGEDERYLQWYVERYEYITLGGLVPISKPQQILWLDRIWNDYLIDGSGRPKVKVHGFGLTARDVMVRYPWYSVDSSSWVMLGAHGNLYMDGKILAFSSLSPSRKVAGQHVDSMPEIIGDEILTRIVAEGYDPQRLRTIGYSRWAYNAEKYSEFGKNMTSWDQQYFTQQQPELFNGTEGMDLCR
jgi:hypothetical protein